MLPTWAETLGVMMTLSSMLMIPGYALYYVLTQPGTILQNIKQGLEPNVTLRREAINAMNMNQVGASGSKDCLSLIFLLFRGRARAMR